MAPADLAPPTMRDVLDARRLLAPHLDLTPARTYPALDRATGARVVVKHENLQPTGAFKVRGALNLLLRLTPEDRARGVTAFNRKSTRLNSSHVKISYAVFCLKQKNTSSTQAIPP